MPKNCTHKNKCIGATMIFCSSAPMKIRSLTGDHHRLWNMGYSLHYTNKAAVGALVSVDLPAGPNLSKLCQCGNWCTWIFWDHKSVLLIDLLHCGATVNVNCYCETLHILLPVTSFLSCTWRCSCLVSIFLVRNMCRHLLYTGFNLKQQTFRHRTTKGDPTV